MIVNLRVALVAALALGLGGTSAQELATKDGNIYLSRTGGREQKITSSGRDHDPSLSPDRRWIVFVRDVDSPLESDEPMPGRGRSQIWIVDVNGGSTRMLFGDGIPYRGSRFVHFFSPQFSPDGRILYFLIPSAVVTNSIIRLEVATRQTKVIGDALSFDVIEKGEYTGFLVIQKRVSVSPYYIYPFWLISPDGAPIREVATDEKGAHAFIHSQESK